MNDSKTTLLPCPFCGSENLMFYPHDCQLALRGTVICNVCGIHSRHHRSSAEAVEHWNTRQPVTVMAEIRITE